MASVLLKEQFPVSLVQQAEEILPNSYLSKDLYFLIYYLEGHLLSTLKDPFNFSRYFWRQEVQYFPENVMNDPALWLYYTIQDVGTDISKAFVYSRLRDKKNLERFLSDASFLLFVEGSVLNEDIVFGHCKISDYGYLKSVLSNSGINKLEVDSLIKIMLQRSNTMEAQKIRFL